MASHRLDADARATGFGIRVEGGATRLDFRQFESDKVEGRSGSLHYGAADVHLDRFGLRFGNTHWSMDSASATRGWLRSEHGSMTMTAERLELPRGLQMTHSATGGTEIIAPHVSLGDVGLEVRHVGEGLSSSFDSPAGQALRREPWQPRLRFLDGLQGMIRMTVHVELELPVIGMRTLDQRLELPIRDGTLDFRALEANLRWLEGAFVDLVVDSGALALRFGVPIFARAAREIIAWQLDADAQSLAAFGRIPLRCLADFRRPRGDDDDKRKRSSLRSFRMSDIDVDLSLSAPHSVNVGDGALLFGGDEGPGLVDVHLGGQLLHPAVAGHLTTIAGKVGLVDITAKDVPLGPLRVSVDRLHLGRIDSLECQFAGFEAVSLIGTMSRATATNMCLVLGEAGQPEAAPPRSPPAASLPPGNKSGQ